jgi:hypothetical protein
LGYAAQKGDCAEITGPTRVSNGLEQLGVGATIWFVRSYGQEFPWIRGV